jgi:hypothetical protein
MQRRVACVASPFRERRNNESAQLFLANGDSIVVLLGGIFFFSIPPS